MRFALLVLLAACRTPPIELSPVDAGPSDMTRPAECAVLPGQLQQIFDTQTSCFSDTDCVAVVTRCGLPGNCGAPVNESALLQIGNIVAAYDLHQCAATIHCSPCPGGSLQAHCTKNVCTLMAPPMSCTDIENQALAIINQLQTCNSDADCRVVGPACGLVCSAYLTATNAAKIAPLLDAWRANNCDKIGCPPCVAPTPPKCNAGGLCSGS